MTFETRTEKGKHESKLFIARISVIILFCGILTCAGETANVNNSDYMRAIFSALLAIYLVVFGATLSRLDKLVHG